MRVADQLPWQQGTTGGDSTWLACAGRPVTAALIWDDRFATHDMGRAALYLPVEGLIEDAPHLDNTGRIVRTRNLIARAGLDEVLSIASPRDATVEELERVHSIEHIERMQAVSVAGAGDAGGGYTPMDGCSYGLALLSAGSALTALELVLRGEATTAHAMLRRSGHHAWRDSGLGFCIFNNCAVAARAAQADFGLERVAIVDIDAHHGNGTEAIFYEDPTVLSISIHQDRSFPVETGSVESVGKAEAVGKNVNVNLPAGTGDPGYHYALDRIVVPILRDFRPELIVVACGVDASLFDPLSRLGLTAAGFAGVAGRLLTVADDVCGGRIVSVQEGGYSEAYAPFCWLAIVETIARLPRHDDPYEPFIAGQPCCRELLPWQQEAIDDQARFLARYWPL
jgi:acetoin utilization deacetylase AcuC-like enzyme